MAFTVGNTGGFFDLRIQYDKPAADKGSANGRARYFAPNPVLLRSID